MKNTKYALKSINELLIATGSHVIFCITCYHLGLATELFQRKGVRIPVLRIKSVPVRNTRAMDGIPMNRFQSLAIASLLGDIKQAALYRAGASLRVADKRSDTGGRVATLIGTASWEVDERLDVAG